VRKIFFNEEYQKEFLKRGYITMPMLSDEEVAYLLNEIGKLNPADNFSPSGDKYRFDYHATLLDSDIEYKRNATRLVREFFSPHIKKILVDYQILTGGVFVKQPNGGEVAVHRDWTFTDNFNDTNVNFWCPLIDVDEVNGTLQMVDGTHKLVSNIMCPHTTPFFYQYSESLKKKSTAIPLKAGEALFFENTILHWSAPNNSSEPRFAATFMCIPNEAKAVFYYPDKSVANKRFKVFEMDSESFNQHIGQDYYDGNIRTKSLGFVENRNRILSEEEFFELMKNGDEIRRKIYFPEEAVKSDEKVSLTKRIKSLFAAIISR
jgi:hypothetical protein